MTETRFYLVVLLSMAMVLIGASCLQTDPETGTNDVQKTGQALQTAAHALPGPIGGIVAGGGALLTLIGGFFAGRAKDAAFKEGGPAKAASLNPLTKSLAERKWLFPIVAGVIDAAALAGVPMDLSVLGLLNAALVAPAAGEFVKDAKKS